MQLSQLSMLSEYVGTLRNHPTPMIVTFIQRSTHFFHHDAINGGNLSSCHQGKVVFTRSVGCMVRKFTPRAMDPIGVG